MPHRKRAVIDANVAMGLASVGMLRAFAKRHVLMAPPLFWSETRSALHVEGRRRGDEAGFRNMYLDIQAAPIECIEHDDSVTPWDLATTLNWAKVYDAEYLSLALQQRAALATVDRRLARAAIAHGVVLAPIA
jgi:predicted nucleic acid-binding protein